MANKILLVDDSKTQLDVMKTRFLKSGFEVEVVENAIDGYHKIFNFIPDIILSDVIMPNLDGYQFCRLLKNNKITRKIPIILLTVLDKKLDKFWAKNSGAEKFISKTADFEEIKSQTLEVLESSKLTDTDKENIKNNVPSQISMSEKINDILNSLLMQSTFLNEFRNLGEYYTQEKVLVHKMFELLSTFIDYDFAGIFFNKPDKSAKNILYFDLKDRAVSPFVIEKFKREFFAQMPTEKTFNTNDFVHEITREDQNSEKKIISPNAIKTEYVLPFVYNEKLLGGIGFYSKDEIDYKSFKFHDEFEKEVLALLKMKTLYSEVEFLSITDGLTGLYNRRYFEHNLEREFLRAKRYKNNLSMAMLDIDLFKKVNDTHGHQYGDYVLKEVAKLLKESFRKTDMLYRYGGEELAIIMPETSLENATIPAERLREKIENHEFIYNGTKINLTVSIGVSTMDDAFGSQKEIVKASDLALYHAKNTGRNKVVIYNEQFNDYK